MHHSAGGGGNDTSVALVHIGLLGGFRVERGGAPISDFAWQRRSAKRVTKLLAIRPGHAAHRDEVLETLWPNADLASARNSLSKALHAARCAIEPERLPREGSPYIRVRDDLITLGTEHVVIDADEFQRLGRDAFHVATVAAYEDALAAYTGVLLPEDLYEDWVTERRDSLAELNIRLLISLAEALEKRGRHRDAVDRLRTALEQDPTREDVHRQLMRLYGALGARCVALRQFETCRSVLRERLNVAPIRRRSPCTSGSRPTRSSSRFRRERSGPRPAPSMSRPTSTRTRRPRSSAGNRRWDCSSHS